MFSPCHVCRGVRRADGQQNLHCTAASSQRYSLFHNLNLTEQTYVTCDVQVVGFVQVCAICWKYPSEEHLCRLRAPRTHEIHYLHCV